MKTLLLLFLSFTTCLSETALCPSKEDIKPCSCSGDDRKIWVSCEAISSMDELRNALNGMKDYKLSTFFLTKSDIGTLSADLFADIEIEDLKIMFTNLTGLSESINRPPFLGQEQSLESLEIRESFTDENSPLTRLSLSHLKKLSLLQLEANLLPTIGNDWFESGPYALKELYLLDTSTDTLGSHAFASLTNLRKLSLTGGRISEISRGMFAQPALFLDSLDFSDNRITTIPNDLFAKMPSLTEVFFENNALKIIDEVSFAPVWSQLSHAYFYGNPLVCDQMMKWIFKYRLPESLQGHCATPQTLQFRPLTNLTLSDFE